jgi:hypothetical protein
MFGFRLRFRFMVFNGTFNNIIIVDSPGIGDVPEMTNIVLDYLMEASAFVFIINTIDGVQISRVCIMFTIFHFPLYLINI